MELAAGEYASQLEAISPNDPHGTEAYLTSHGLTLGIAASELYRLGLVTSPLPGDERFRGMLSIPYLTPAGVAAITFRKLATHGNNVPKFSQYAGQKKRLYNVNAYFAAGESIGLAEGEIDAIVATEILGLPTLGIPGAKVWHDKRKIWAPVLKDFRSVIVFTDGDPEDSRTGQRPGLELSRAIAETLGWRVRIIECPEGEDVSSMVAKGETETLRRQVFPDKRRDGG